VFRGFGDPVVMFVAALFIVTAGLEATGVTAWVGQQFERAVAGDPDRLLVIGMVAVAALCPMINASGAVGALMPVVMLMAVRLSVQPSRFLMPMAFSSGAGAHLALTGAPKNVLIADAAGDYGTHALNFFEFALVGIPILIGTVGIVLLLGKRLVPERTAPSLPSDLSAARQDAGGAVPADDGRLRPVSRPRVAARWACPWAACRWDAGLERWSP
jgi:Na+/H+ antiporter NhaD/arsenite permease-like protein